MNEEKVFNKTAINWYPGHMAKTKRQIKEKIDLIDIIYEVVDSRIPISSKIKDIDENINISFNNGNIIMERDNNESNLLFNFVLDKETESKYFIKSLNFYIDTKVKTNHLQIDDDRIIIEYDLWLSDEYSGNFKYEIILKEV